jgi:L-lactate dehydrogenase complex protein LldG
MSSRDAILAAVRAAAPEPTPLPPPFRPPAPDPGTANADSGSRDADRVRRFREAAEAAGATVIASGSRGDDWLDRVVGERFPDVKTMASAIATAESAPDGARPAGGSEAGGPARVDLQALAAHELADVELVVLAAELGVAENGAVWLPESRLGQRAAPFLAQHLLVVLDPDRIVEDMHDAYARVQVDAEGFGLFMAGPSKTADIEQSLVIGAHGPRSLTIVLLVGDG